MVEAGKAGAVGKNTVLLYLATTLVAAVEGLTVALLFKGNFSTKETVIEPTFLHFLCPFDNFKLVQLGSDVICKNASEILPESTEASFEILVENSYYKTNGEDFETVSFSDSLQEGIFRQLVPENILEEFANGGFVGVVMFGIVFGAASARLSSAPVLLLELLEDINDILVRIIGWVILVTPLAVFSLIAGALAEQDNLAETFSDIGYLVAAAIVGVFCHITIVYPALFYFVTRENPFSYMKFLFPAQVFAFSCASSAATLPVTFRCVKASGQVPDSIRDFVLPIGATVNMDGGALYFPSALLFLAQTAGLETGFAELILIVLVSTFGSAGAAPVPNANLVLIITAFNTVYGGTGTPDNFALIVAIDWLMDRFQTPLNVTGDAMVCRMVAFLSEANVTPGRPTSQL